LRKRYKLPSLPYKASALEPILSGKVVELHWDKHFRGYVENANRALQRLEEIQEKREFESLMGATQDLVFNASGFVMHQLYFECIGPKAGGEPEGELLDAIKERFKTFERFKQQFNALGESLKGSGWVVLIWEPHIQSLELEQIHDHQRNLIHCSWNLMCVDVWEHAYYLQYQNRKSDYLEGMWKLWNWEYIQTTFAKSRKAEGVFNA
jgi:Fe-Mn family superoxide dismutase